MIITNGENASCLQRPCREENKSHSSYSYCRNTNNRDELSDKPMNAPPTKRGTRRGTKRGKRSREPERAPGCTFVIIDRYDDQELRASIGGVTTVQDAGDQTVEADVRAKRDDQSGPPLPESDTRSRLAIAFRQDTNQWVRATTARAGQ